MEIADVEWIDPAQAERLNTVGVVNDDELLVRGATRAGRRDLAAASGIPEEAILTWVKRIELLRLDGIHPKHINLLAAAGVDGTRELARRDARHLADTLAELNRTRATKRDAPFVGEVVGWIDAARGATSAVES